MYLKSLYKTREKLDWMTRSTLNDQIAFKIFKKILLEKS